MLRVFLFFVFYIFALFCFVFVTEPLAFDLTESSSNTVFSPTNMTMKLRCVVQGGEPPIKISLSRQRMIMTHALGRSLGLLLRPSFQDGGRYVCKATDARRRTVTHVISLKVPGEKMRILHVRLERRSAANECNIFQHAVQQKMLYSFYFKT